MKPQVYKRIPEADRFLRHCDRQVFRPKMAVFRQGEKSDALYIVLEGSISVLIEDANNPEQAMVVSYLNPGDFFGEMGLFGEAARTANVIAREDCEIARIGYEEFHKIRNEFPEILYALTRQLGSRLRTTTRKLTDLAFVDVAGRIAQALMDLTKQPDAMTHPKGIQIRVTRQELGKMVGCSREMAGRVLKALSEDGLIDVSGKTIVVKHQSDATHLDDDGNIIP